MKRLLLGLALLIAFPAVDASAWDQSADPLFCRSYKKKKSFCFRWPNLAMCLNACAPQPEIIGAIEWCRRSYTKVDVDECGRTIQYRATDITYRYVLCNGAYGECFVRTQRDGPITYPEQFHYGASHGKGGGKECVSDSPQGGKVSIFK